MEPSAVEPPLPQRDAGAFVITDAQAELSDEGDSLWCRLGSPEWLALNLICIGTLSLCCYAASHHFMRRTYMANQRSHLPVVSAHTTAAAAVNPMAPYTGSMNAFSLRPPAFSEPQAAPATRRAPSAVPHVPHNILPPPQKRATPAMTPAPINLPAHAPSVSSDVVISPSARALASEAALAYRRSLSSPAAPSAVVQKTNPRPRPPRRSYNGSAAEKYKQSDGDTDSEDTASVASSLSSTSSSQQNISPSSSSSFPSSMMAAAAAVAAAAKAGTDFDVNMLDEFKEKILSSESVGSAVASLTDVSAASSNTEESASSPTQSRAQVAARAASRKDASERKIMAQVYY